MERYAEVDRAHWDERAPAHASSPDYQLGQFVEDPHFLSHVVRFDLPRLGDLGGLRGVHLQCHIGTDTISLARLGASMTGLDFSPVSLAQARELADRAGNSVEFVQAELYEALSVLERGSFDVVYSGVGALCWLPSVRRWADVVAGLLVPGGRLFLREGHPVMWALDYERSDSLLALEYDYFERGQPMAFEDEDSYVQTDASFTHNLNLVWNHGLGEIVTSVMAAGMELTLLVEHDSLPWGPLPGQMTKDELGEWHLIDRPWRLRLSYTLQAVKRS